MFLPMMALFTSVMRTVLLLGVLIHGGGMDP